MKNLKVYSTLFVSILLFSQSVFAQNLKLQNDRSLKPEKRIESKTEVTVQDQNEHLKLEERKTETTAKRSASSTISTRPTIKEGATVSNELIVDKKISASGNTVKGNSTVNKISSTPIVKKEVIETSNNVQSVGQPSSLKVNGSVSSAAQKVIAQPAANPMVSSNDVKPELFYGDSRIKAELKAKNVELYREYLKERQTIATIISRVTANTFKNGAEQSKYTQLLNSYKQKYNF